MTSPAQYIAELKRLSAKMKGEPEPAFKAPETPQEVSDLFGSLFKKPK